MDFPSFCQFNAGHPFAYAVPWQQQQQPRQQAEQQLAGSIGSLMNLDDIPIRYALEKPQSEWRKDFFTPEYLSLPGLSQFDYPQIATPHPAIDYDPRTVATPPADPRPAEAAENMALNRRLVLVIDKRSSDKGKEKAVTLKSPKWKKKRLANSIQITFLPGLAFLNSDRDGCTLREIYTFVMYHFEGYTVTKSESWKKTIRHSLVTHRDCYVKGQGDAFWQFSNKQRFLEMLHAYCAKKSVKGLGLKNPIMWPYILEGKVGLAPMVEYPTANTVEKKKEPFQHKCEIYPNYLNPEPSRQDPKAKPYVLRPFVDYYPAFPTYKPTPREQLPREDDLFGHLVPPQYRYTGAAQLLQQVPQMEATYEWNNQQFAHYHPLG